MRDQPTLRVSGCGCVVACADWWSIVLGGSCFGGSAFAVSSSDMPFLKALMPCATSPISSEILPRPNSSKTTAMTMIQCQILSEPIENPPERGLCRPLPLVLKLGFGHGKNKDFGPINRAGTPRFAAAVNGSACASAPADVRAASV